MADMFTPDPQCVEDADILELPDLKCFRVTHIKGSGPRGGRPVQRDMIVDAAGVETMLDMLPPTDRIRLPSGEELACRGGRNASTVDALVPLMTSEQVHVEIMRRQTRAFADDLAEVRRATLDAQKEVLRNATDTSKVIGALQDMTMSMMERFTTSLEALASKQSSDLTEQVVGAVITQLTGSGGNGGGILGALRGRGGNG